MKGIGRRDFIKFSGLSTLGLFAATLHPMLTFGLQKFKIAWSHYTGWEPWEYARHAGIIKKWADKYGIEIELSKPLDYTESMNLYNIGQYDGVVVTNMDMLISPALAGKDSTAIIIGDFSNGNDGICLKNSETVADIKGRKAYMVMGSVTQYLFSRMCSLNAIKEKDVKLFNASESDIVSLFSEDKNPMIAVGTWNPYLMQVRNLPKTKMIFDSSKIPGEIIDMLIVRTDASDTLKKALTGAWFETMQIMGGAGKEAKEAKKFMANTAGCVESEFESQLKTTAIFYTPAEAVEFTKSQKLRETMEYVRTFCFDHGLYGKGIKNKDYVGIQFPDGSIIGDKQNIKMRFDATYMQMAAEGKL